MQREPRPAAWTVMGNAVGERAHREAGRYVLLVELAAAVGSAGLVGRESDHGAPPIAARRPGSNGTSAVACASLDG